MGFADYLQSKLVPFESPTAVSINRGMFKNIKDKALAHTKVLGELRGEAPDAKGYGIRNTHLLAVAPNANSSIILGVSPSIEPRASNCYTHKTRVGSYLVKNLYLQKELAKIGLDTDEIWHSILANNGSVQHLDISDDLKKVFKTAFELNQEWVVIQAKARSEYICQGQSVNLFFSAGADKEYVNRVHRLAFVKGDDGFEPLKGLYYLRTESSLKTEKVNVKVERDRLQDGVQGSLDSCTACQG